jgi:hypothetical protein
MLRVKSAKLTKHARKRAEERLPFAVNETRLGWQIRGALKAGRQVRSDGSISVPVGHGWCAICQPRAEGGWNVITFLRQRGTC